MLQQNKLRAEQLKEKYDFVVSRAVTRLPEFVKWVKKNISEKQKNAVPNGVIYLKGGDLNTGIKTIQKEDACSETFRNILRKNFLKQKNWCIYLYKLRLNLNY